MSYDRPDGFDRDQTIDFLSRIEQDTRSADYPDEMQWFADGVSNARRYLEEEAAREEENRRKEEIERELIRETQEIKERQEREDRDREEKEREQRERGYY